MSSNRLSILTMWPFGKNDTSAQSAATRAEPSTLQALQSLVLALPDPVMLIDRGGFVRILIGYDAGAQLGDSAGRNHRLGALTGEAAAYSVDFERWSGP